MRIIGCFIILCALAVESCAQVPGCTDPLATNYNSSATINNGSCFYPPASVAPLSAHLLSDTLAETSGLIWWNNLIWTHNDNTDRHLYGIDSGNAHIVQQVEVDGVTNQDWEEITHDDDYIYVGEFGNNVSGNRQNLHILRIGKSTFGTPAMTADTIRFSYADQTDFTATAPNNSDYDCEAFIASADSLYLFTKQWISKKTAVYALPKTPGNHAATLRDTLNVSGLVTGAVYLPSKRTIALSGYEINGLILQPFVYLLYDFTGTSFFSGNRRRINISQNLAQVEGITTADGKSFYITNETIANSIITIPAKLQRINLSPYLQPYYQTHVSSLRTLTNESVTIYPNPASGTISLKIIAPSAETVQMQLFDTNGSRIWQDSKKLSKGSNELKIDVPEMASGNYWLQLKANKATVRKKVVYSKN